MLLRIVRDGGRGVLWSCDSWASCATSAALTVFSFFSSGVMLFVRLCLLPTRLMRRMPPMNRRLPFPSSCGSFSGGAELCASLEWSSHVSWVVVEDFFTRWTSSTLAEAERCLELARLLVVAGLRGRECESL